MDDEKDELKLKFDEIKEETDLAKNYIDDHNREFYPVNCNVLKQHVMLDDTKNKFYGMDQNQEATASLETEVQAESTLFLQLAQKIEENAELFAQLEMRIRKKRKEDVKRWDINLLVQIFLYQSTQKCYPYEDIREVLTIHSDSALADLGDVASILTRKRVLIMASPNTGAVSHLFTKLCHEVGLTSVSVAYDEPNGSSIASSDFDQGESLGMLGCVGVITAYADIDSAVGTLLSSTTQYPWKVRRILIHESIYETVVKSMEWKINMKITERSVVVVVDAKFEKSCVDAKYYEDKLLLFYYTGNYKDILTVGPNVNIVFVGAYKTSKELLSLINLYEPLFLSLWSCDVAESDEIAFSVNAPIVWVNEFGSFWGPSIAAEAYYSSVYTGIFTIKMNSDMEKLLKLRDAWRKIDIRSRNAVLKEVINSSADYENNKEKVLKLISSQRWRDSEKFVDIQINRICIGRRDRDEVYMPWDDSNVEDIFGFLIGGGAVMFDAQSSCVDPFKSWIEALTIKGVPILLIDYCVDAVKAGGVRYNRTARANTKVVYKSFGTIFAN